MLNITKIAIASVAVLTASAAVAAEPVKTPAPAAAAQTIAPPPNTPTAPVIAPSVVTPVNVPPAKIVPAPAAAAPAAKATATPTQTIALQDGRKLAIKGDHAFLVDAKGKEAIASDGSYTAKDGKVYNTKGGLIVK